MPRPTARARASTAPGSRRGARASRSLQAGRQAASRQTSAAQRPSPPGSYVLRRGSELQSSGLVGDGLLAACGSALAVSAKLMCLRSGAEQSKPAESRCHSFPALGFVRCGRGAYAAPASDAACRQPRRAAAAGSGRKRGARVGQSAAVTQSPALKVKRPSAAGRGRCPSHAPSSARRDVREVGGQRVGPVERRLAAGTGRSLQQGHGRQCSAAAVLAAVQASRHAQLRHGRQRKAGHALLPAQRRQRRRCCQRPVFFQRLCVARPRAAVRRRGRAGRQAVRVRLRARGCGESLRGLAAGSPGAIGGRAAIAQAAPERAQPPLRHGGRHAGCAAPRQNHAGARDAAGSRPGAKVK